MSLGRFQNYNARIVIDDREVADHFKLIQFGICRFTGGGMQLTEQPDPFDGLFDISIGGRLRAIDVLTNVFRLFNGSITRHPKIKTFKGSHLRVDYDSNCTLAVQADGEWLGEGAFEARILHKTISVIVPDAAFCED